MTHSPIPRRLFPLESHALKSELEGLHVEIQNDRKRVIETIVNVNKNKGFHALYAFVTGYCVASVFNYETQRQDRITVDDTASWYLDVVHSDIVLPRMIYQNPYYRGLIHHISSTIVYDFKPPSSVVPELGEVYLLTKGNINFTNSLV